MNVCSVQAVWCGSLVEGVGVAPGKRLSIMKLPDDGTMRDALTGREVPLPIVSLCLPGRKLITAGGPGSKVAGRPPTVPAES